MAKKKVKSRRRMSARPTAKDGQPRCGLCGKTAHLTRTECCNQWICDDAEEYVAFSYARNSCYRNHDRYTLCGFHYNEGHPGHWKTCTRCRESFKHELEMYVHYGTNEYNFEKLENPPTYKPTHCSKCGALIVLSEGGYSTRGDEHLCSNCTYAEFPGLP